MNVETLPQPSPNAPAPPPSVAAKRSRRWMVAIVLLGVISLVTMGVYLTGKVRSQRRLADRTHVTRTLRSLGMGLYEFESDYGHFPDAGTAIEVKSRTGTSLSLGDATSNDLLKQLIAAGIIQSEVAFYMPGGSSHKPDNICRTNVTALAPGECGLAYVEGVSSADDPTAPLLIAPAISGSRTFNTTTLDHQVAVLQADGRVVTYPIDPSGKIAGPGGMDLLDPRQSFWHGKAPNLKWPK